MKFLRLRLIDRILDYGVPVIQRHDYCQIRFMMHMIVSEDQQDLILHENEVKKKFKEYGKYDIFSTVQSIEECRARPSDSP